jgi:outer membrane protein TolC
MNLQGLGKRGANATVDTISSRALAGSSTSVRPGIWLGLACALLALPRAGRAQSDAHPYFLEDAVNDALANHPRIAASRADERAAEARVTEARTNLLPDAGLSAELNRSTGNTAPGAFFYAPGFVPVAGAPRGKTLDAGVWQTGVSLWASWDVLSLARQAAAIDVALAGRSESQAATNAQRLEVAYRAADAFLLVLEAQETVRAASANVDRAQVLVTMTKPLVDQNLRPGVDLARAQAELANAHTQLARAEQTREVRRAQLSESVGKTGLRVDILAGALMEAPTDSPSSPSHVDGHPAVVQASAAAARLAEARRQVEVEYLPRLDIVAAIWARGSGFLGSPASGLGPDIPNWAAGAVATWSILDIPTIRARAQTAQATYEASIARHDEVVLAVSGQVAGASATLAGAKQIALQTPLTLASARAAEQQATARYKTGLAPVVDVADAQRVLAQAEIDDAVARLEVRRAELLLARASGDLGPFLAQSRKQGG